MVTDVGLYEKLHGALVKFNTYRNITGALRGSLW